MQATRLTSLRRAAVALLATVSTAFAQDAPAHTSVPREVLAFYYTWYGTPARHGNVVHWGKINAEHYDISDSTHYPGWGAYDSDNPDLIDHQIALAKAVGLTGFIATWWGQQTYEDKVVPILLDRAGEKNFKATVYWEVAPGKDRDQIDHAVNDLVYLLTRYGSNPAFLKVGGKPVIFVYGRVMGQVPFASWPAII